VVGKRNTIYVGRRCLGKNSQYGAWWHMAVVKAIDVSGNTKALPQVFMRIIHLVKMYTYRFEGSDE